MDSNNTTYIPLLRDTKDAHYRYKMPKLTAKVEGSGNGIKTVITNMSAIARALHRPPSYPTKYFGCELGAQVQMGHDYVVNGAHDAEKLLTLLYSFIKKFVLCSKCNNPETELRVVDKTIMQKCIACGYQTTIPNTTHRLTTFIINHPPNEDTSSSTNKKGEKKGKEKSSKGKKNGTRSPTSSDEKKNNQNENGNLDDNNHDINDEFDDFDDDLQTISEGIKSVQVDDPLEKANKFLKMINDKKEQLNDVNIQKELLNESKNLDIGDKATLLLSEALFTDNICEQIKAYRSLLLRFCLENKKAQKYLLGGFEKLVGEIYKEKLLNKVATILKTFYDNDVLEEEVLIEWSEKPSKKYVSKDISKIIHEKATPFIKWLKEAEVEEDSDDNDSGGNHKKITNNDMKQNTNNYEEDDEDDDFDIEYSHRVDGLVTVENKTKSEDVEDINIDDI